jgi:hypothetical protein
MRKHWLKAAFLNLKKYKFEPYTMLIFHRAPFFDEPASS